jgi:hypothetical protein
VFVALVKLIIEGTEMDVSLWHLWLGASREQLIAPTVVVGFVVVLCLWYLTRYFYRSFRLSRRLKRLTAGLIKAKALAPAQRRSELEEMFKGTRLEHSWDEYSETLHDQFEFREGEQFLVRSRATVGASHFFSPQSVVDSKRSINPT